MIILAKQTVRLNIKGVLDVENGKIHEYDKDLGEITHNLSDLFADFNGKEDVTLTLAYDNVIEGEAE